MAKKLSSSEVFAREDLYGAHNYHPLPVALCKGEGKVSFWSFLTKFLLKFSGRCLFVRHGRQKVL